MKTNLALLLLLAAAPALAQDDGAAAPAPAKDEKPQPAMTASLAGKRTLVSVALAGSTLIAVGDRGHIMASDDGKAWKQVKSPTDVMLNRVRFRDDKTGFALGHDAAILVTRDGGSSWTAAHFDANGRALYDVAALDEQRAFAIGGYGTFLDSADGGATWTAREFPIGELGQHFNAVTRLGDGSLLVVGEKGLLMRSTDEGATWGLIDSPYTGSFFGVLPHGDKGAIAFGLRGNVFVADDVSRCPALAVEGYDPYSRQTVTDSAQLAKLGWRLLTTPTTESLFGGARTDSATLLVGVNGTVVKIDAVATAATTPRAPDGDTLGDVVFRNGRWLAVGRRGAVDLGAF